MAVRRADNEKIFCGRHGAHGCQGRLSCQRAKNKIRAFNARARLDVRLDKDDWRGGFVLPPPPPLQDDHTDDRPEQGQPAHSLVATD